MIAFNRKKGQAAMEFLMTYGWAILVVLVVIGALSYFGVLSPSTLLPEKCTFPVSLSCLDFSIGNSQINLILQNGAGRDMVVTAINASSQALGDGNGDQLCTTAIGVNTTLRNGASVNFLLATPVPATACTFFDTGRDKNKYSISVSYAWLDSRTITHISNGDLLAKKP